MISWQTDCAAKGRVVELVESSASSSSAGAFTSGVPTSLSTNAALVNFKYATVANDLSEWITVCVSWLVSPLSA